MSLVLVGEHDGYLEIVLNRPEKLNALNQQLIDELTVALEKFETGNWAAAILTGAGERGFCAGADFNDPPEDDAKMLHGFGIELSKPLIAALHGHVVGGGFVLSQTADIVVADETAKLSYPEAHIGVTGGMATFLSTRAPFHAVSQLLLTALPFDAQASLTAGFVSELVPAGQHVKRAHELAARIASNDLECVKALKALLGADVRRSTTEVAQLSSQLTKYTTNRDNLIKNRGLKGSA